MVVSNREKLVVENQQHEDQVVNNACMMQKDCEELIDLLNDVLSKQEQGISFMEGLRLCLKAELYLLLSESHY